MNLLNFGWGPFLAGLALLAGGLYLLQRLRVKYREVQVVSTIFWKQAVEETRARVFRRRFRHPWAYLLAALICGLIWLAVAEPRWNREGERDHVFLLDGSAGMGWGGRFASACALLQREVERIPAEKRRVYFCAGETRLVLDRGEETYLLQPRLESLAPEPCPSALGRELWHWAGAGETGLGLKVFLVGDGPLDEAQWGRLPDWMTVERLREEETPVMENNAGVAAVGVSEAASGAFERVDVMADIAGGASTPFVATLNGQDLVRAGIVPEAGSREGRYYFRNVPAGGGLFQITLTVDDALLEDNLARIILPKRELLPVALAEGIDERFRTLVEVDPALTEVPAGTTERVMVGRFAATARPALELIPGQALRVVYEPGLEEAEVARVRDRFSGLGWDRVGRKLEGSGSFAGAGGVVPAFEEGDRRRVELGEDLLGEDFDFVQTSAFPLLVLNAIRWLAGVEPVEPFARAGEPLWQPGRLAAAGSDYAPPRAGLYRARDGRDVAASLPAVPRAALDVAPRVTQSSVGGRWPGLWTWCVLAALLLVAGEWWLFQKGRMP